MRFTKDWSEEEEAEYNRGAELGGAGDRGRAGGEWPSVRITLWAISVVAIGVFLGVKIIDVYNRLIRILGIDLP